MELNTTFYSRLIQKGRLLNYQLIFLLGLGTQLGLPSLASAQTIQFSVYVASSLDATKDQDLDMGEVISGSGYTEVLLGDPGMGVFSITGNEELDVIVTMVSPTKLTHTGASADEIAFTLNFAYANKNANNVNDAIVASGGTARFKMKERSSGPAGAPPTPPSGTHTPQEATAYIYIYGNMTVGDIEPGTYTGDVDLSVTYD